MVERALELALESDRRGRRVVVPEPVELGGEVGDVGGVGLVDPCLYCLL